MRKKLIIISTSLCLILLNPIKLHEEMPITFTKSSQLVIVDKAIEVKVNTIEPVKQTIVLKTEEIITIKPVTFNPYNIGEPSNITIEELHRILKGTGLEDVSESILRAEKECGVNAVFLSSLIALESGWGKSARAKQTNNMGGVAVYSNISRGVIYNTRGDSVLHIAEFLRRDYLNKDGQFYKGISIWNVNIKYCETKTWSKEIISIANGFLKKCK